MKHGRKKIGIMGGTFDPIHIGHLATAEIVRTTYRLDQVLFIPNGLPPHKQEMQVTPAVHRYIMTLMATCSNPYFLVVPMEIERPGLSYTIDTVKKILAEYGPETDLYCITGFDAILDLFTWKDATQLLQLCQFIAVARLGYENRTTETIDAFPPEAKHRIHILTAPRIDISATDIRQRVRQGGSVRYLVPENVEQYIYKERLYLD